MRDRQTECGVDNLDRNTGFGTHWVAYKKKGRKMVYFDSFGNLKPPKEFIRYMKKSKIYVNLDQYQQFGTSNCGHLVLTFLYNET